MTHIGVFDSEAEGSPLFFSPLDEPLGVEAGDTVRLTAGAVTIALGGAVSAWLANAMLDRVLRGAAWPTIAARYLAILSSFTSDAVHTELAGDGYARRACDFAAAETGEDGCVNSDEIAFPPATADWPTATHAAVFDAATGGRLLWRGELTTPREVAAGRRLVFAPGALCCTLD